MNNKEVVERLKDMYVKSKMKANGFTGINEDFEKDAEALEIAINNMEALVKLGDIMRISMEFRATK